MSNWLTTTVGDAPGFPFPIEWVKAALVLAFMSACLVVGLLSYLNHHLRRTYARLWIVAWMFYAVYLAASIDRLESPGSGLLNTMRQVSVGVSALFMSWGSFELAKSRRNLRELGLAVAFILAWACVASSATHGRLGLAAVLFALLGTACIGSGIVYVRYRQYTRGANILGAGLVLWGADMLAHPFLEVSPGGMAACYLVSASLSMMIIIGMVLDQEYAVAEQLYATVVDSANEAIFLLDCVTLRILEANLAAQHLTEHSRSDLMGRRFSEACPELATECSAPPERGGTFGASFQPCREFEVVRPDGKRVVCESTTTIVHRPSGPLLQLSVRDISERKQLEAQLLHAQKMEAVGRLAGGVAHDFNNILTVIMGHSELLMQNDSADDATRQGVREIGTAAERAASLTRQLLAFSRKQMLEPKVLCLNDVVARTSGMLQRLIGEDVDLEMRLDGDGWVRVDPGQVEQVIMNLAVNARDAMPQGGKLTIETANVTLDQDYAQRRMEVTPGDYVMLAVTDTGEGMSKEVQARLFEPFFTTKPTGKGTGLGLATCHGIVKQSSGHIGVYSELGHGTTFKVYLPRVQQQDAEVCRREQPAKTGGGAETLLLVEDEPVVRELACLVLRKQGYEVLEAADGSRALELVETNRSGRIDLLITDLVMPEIGGKELANRLRATRPDLKVLFCSGYTQDAVVHNGVLADKAAFLQKPYTPTTLGQKVRETIDCLNN